MLHYTELHYVALCQSLLLSIHQSASHYITLKLHYITTEDNTSHRYVFCRLLHIAFVLNLRCTKLMLFSISLSVFLLNISAGTDNVEHRQRSLEDLSGEGKGGIGVGEAGGNEIVSETRPRRRAVPPPLIKRNTIADFANTKAYQVSMASFISNCDQGKLTCHHHRQQHYITCTTARTTGLRTTTTTRTTTVAAAASPLPPLLCDIIA